MFKIRYLVVSLSGLVIIASITILIISESSRREHYTAGVVEYHPDPDTSTNLQNYIHYIKQAGEQNVDILVFPEMTLTRGTSVEVPIHGLLQEHRTPADHPDKFDDLLVQLSKATREANTYVVVNVQEQMNCSNAPGETCPTAELYRFNTNVVFDRYGQVIDRYRKINLFGESGRTPAFEDGRGNLELGVFSTDFGVTFGHFICFDLMFQEPALRVVQQLHVTDVVFTTMWFAEAPFLTAVEIQEAYAVSLNVNFLAAGASNVAIGSAGSGIYSGKAGQLVSINPGTNTRRLLVQDVPKTPGDIRDNKFPGAVRFDPKTLDNLVLKRDQSIPAHRNVLLESGKFHQFNLQDRGVFCRFTVKLLEGTGEQKYVYRATAFGGVRSFDGLATGGSRVCSVLACSNSSVESCGLRFESFAQRSAATFEILEIDAYMPEPQKQNQTLTDDAAYFPTTLDTSILPLSTTQYSYKASQVLHEMRLVDNEVEILAFGVWGRYYGEDGLPATMPIVKTKAIS